MVIKFNNLTQGNDVNFYQERFDVLESSLKNRSRGIRPEFFLPTLVSGLKTLRLEVIPP